MLKIIGYKEKFAIGVDITKMEPTIWGKSCLWINNYQIGDIDDENILAPFIRVLMQLSTEYSGFNNEIMENLSCREVFYKIYPYYNEPEKLLSSTMEELEEHSSFDKFSLHLGENFDSWSVNALLKKDFFYRFIWVHYPKRDADSYEVRNDIKCFDVPLINVRNIYKEFCTLIPDEYWPSLIKKLE